ncbi:MAG: ribonuclease D [Planctomycetota bacterium]
MNFRRRKRSIHHAEAHADEAPSKIRVMEHPIVPQGHAPVVQTPAELAELVEHLRSAGTFAYDTEFIGEENFHPRICLVQVATAERVAIIDPTQTPDLSGIWSAVCDERLVTLVHAGGQDVNAAQRAAGTPARNVVDTQVGAALMGMPWPASLANTVESLTGHRLSKGHTFTDWDARPLTASQISYAADDVRYLPLVWQRMHERLAELGRVDWARHECELEIKSSESFDPESQVRRACRGMNLRPRVMTILRELVVLRYELARTKDVPPRTLLADAPLLDVARAKPESVRELDDIRGLPRPVVQESGQAIIDCIARAKELPIDRDRIWTPPDENADDRMKIDALWSILNMRCIGMHLAPTMVLTRQQLSRWYLARQKDPAARLFEEGDWRHAAIGVWLDSFMAGKERLELEWGPQGPQSAG